MFTFSNGFGSASITCLDQRPVNRFFEKAFGLKRTSQMECYQDNVNEMIKIYESVARP